MDSNLCNICTELRGMFLGDYAMREHKSHLKLAFKAFAMSFVSGFLFLAFGLAAYAAKSGGGSLFTDAGNDALWMEGILAGLGAPAAACLLIGSLSLALAFAMGVMGTALLVVLCIGMEGEAHKSAAVHEEWVWLVSMAFLAVFGWFFGGAASSLVLLGIGCAFFSVGCILFFRIDKERERGIAA